MLFLAKGRINLSLFVWFLSILVSNQAISQTGPKTDDSRFYVLSHTRHSPENMTSVSAGHIILTLTQPIGSGWSEQGSNP